MELVKSLFAIALGSGLGGCLRYLSGRWLSNFHFFSLPWGTLTVNLAGCFLLGAFYALSDKYGWINSNWKLMLTVGFCGGLTTFSTFMNENMQMIKNDALINMLLYMGVSVAVGLLMIYLGYSIIKLL